LLLMMRIRDEAHRRAISYHRQLRGKDLKESVLDLVPGVGRRRKKLLLEHFKDIGAVADATVDALVSVPGISGALASNIYSFFREKGLS
jgi:excinuclease ABC subunit C